MNEDAYPNHYELITKLNECFSWIFVFPSNILCVLTVLFPLLLIKARHTKTQIICDRQSKLKKIIEEFDCLKAGFKPPFWGVMAIPSTLAGRIQTRIKLNYEREIISLPDGGQLALDWHNCGHAKEKLVMLLLPGINGSSKTPSLTHFVDEARKKNCISVVMNYRGIECDLLTTRLFCATDNEDLEFVLEHIKALYPQHSIFVNATSLGGMLLAGFLAKQPKNHNITHTLIISVPFNAEATLLESEKIQNVLINKHLVQFILKIFKRHKDLYKNDSKLDIDEILKSRSLRELYAAYNVKYGFSSFKEFFAAASVDSKIEKISIPTIFLNSIDDMLSPSKAFPLIQIRSNPNTALILTEFGGHGGFISRSPLECDHKCFLVRDYLDSILKEKAQVSGLLANSNKTIHF